MPKNHKSQSPFFKVKAFIIVFLFISQFSFSQVIGDYISLSNGAWSTLSTWGVVTGTGPLTWGAAATVPAAGNDVYVRTGHTVTIAWGTSYFCTNLTVEAGAKLYSNNVTAGQNTYVSFTGNILCNGAIGNSPGYDNICFNSNGANSTISGSGTFDASRLRKNSASIATTNLTINMNVNLWFQSSSTTQLYNNCPTASIFNVTVGPSATLNLLQSGPNTGHASIDGISGAFLPNTIELGGTWTINGTMIISGSLYLGTDNANATYKCNWIINGLVTANEIVAGASGLGGSSMTVNSGGKLEIAGVNAWSALSPTNNAFNFVSGSTVEYSAVGAQTVRVASEFGSTAANNQYGNLVLSFSGNKTCLVTALYVKNDLRISNTAVLIPFGGSNIFVGGNWYNYNQSGFTENGSTVRFNNAASVGQSINCPGGEIFFTLVQNSGSNLLTFNCAVTVTNQLSLASGNGLVVLNGNSLTVLNNTISGILGGATTRYIISESTDNSSRIIWNIGTGTTVASAFTFPFGVLPANAANYCPVTIFKTSASDIGNVTISTYGTSANNLPWPTTPTLVTNLWADNAIYNVPDNRGYTVDRFWQINSTNNVTLDTLRFSYRFSELPNLDPVAFNMRAQRWVPGISYWDRSQYGYTSSSPTAYTVSVPGFNIFNTAWTLSSITSPLPIELLSFEARKKATTVLLDWKTATEINNDFFTLERSSNGRDFYPIAKIDGAGNSSTTRSYSYVDLSPLSGVSFYRLKQTDFDGQYSYSQTVVVNMSKDGNTAVVFPNPAASKAYVTGMDLKNAQLSLYDLQGRKIKDQSYNESTTGVYALDIEDLPNGIYLLEIINDTGRQAVRLIKE